MKMITQKYIQELFTYRDGELYWKVQKGKRIKIGDKAGSLHKNGYYQIKINNKVYKTHRLIYLYHYGYLPKQIDHINRIKDDNKIENLRESNQQENTRNREGNKHSSSKFKGVYWNKESKKWLARIGINNKRIYLGRFINETDAAKCYNEMATQLYGEYAYINKV